MTVLERIPLDRIEAAAREVRPGRALLAIVASVLYGAGWAARKVCVVAWLVVVWSYAAVRIGWQDAAAKTPPGRR